MLVEATTEPEPATSDDVRRPRRQRRLLVVVLCLGLLLTVVALVLNVSLVRRVDRIEGAFDGLPDRPAQADGDTILLIATRPGQGSDVPWLAGVQAVESVMLVEVGSDGSRVEVDTLPAVDDVDAAMGSTRASDVVAAVEAWSGRRVDHLVAIDWQVFSRLADLNGVTTDYAYGSPPEAQHAYLQLVLERTLHTAMRTRPWQVFRVLGVTADGTAVDDQWSTLGLDLFVLRLRDLRSADIDFSMAREAAHQ